MILYSLGNFVFDQFFSDDVRMGMVAKVSFSNSIKPKVELFPSWLGTVQPTILEGDERENALKKLGLPQ